MKKRQVVMRRDQIWGRTKNDSTNGGHAPRYLECQKNHAASIGGYAVDGCREFMGSGPEGTSNALVCAACGCHRNFHRKVRELDEAHEVVCESSSPPCSNS